MTLHHDAHALQIARGTCTECGHTLTVVRDPDIEPADMRSICCDAPIELHPADDHARWADDGGPAD